MTPAIYVPTDVRVQRRGNSYVSTHSSVSAETLARFQLEGYETVLLARLHESPPAGSPEYPIPPDVEVRPLRPGRRLRGLLAGNLIPLAFLPIRRNDIVIAHLPELLGTASLIRGLATRSKTVCNIVATPDVVTRYLCPAPLRPLINPLLKHILWRLALASDAIVAPTASLLPPPQKRSHAHRAAIPNVILSADFVSKRPPGPRRRSSKPLRLISVGHLRDDGKGMDAVIRVASILNAMKVPNHLTIVGSGPLASTLQVLANTYLEPGSYTFTGELSARSLAEQLKDSDIYISCSRSEAHGRSILEAMYLGLPAVAFRVGGIPDYLPEEQMAPIEDTQAMANLVAALAKSDAQYQAASRLALQISWSTVQASAPVAWHTLLRSLSLGSAQ